MADTDAPGHGCIEADTLIEDALIEAHGVANGYLCSQMWGQCMRKETDQSALMHACVHAAAITIYK